MGQPFMSIHQLRNLNKIDFRLRRISTNLLTVVQIHFMDVFSILIIL